MKKILTYCVLLCGVVLTANAINYPTYRPAGVYAPDAYRVSSGEATPMLEMRSTRTGGGETEEWGLYNPFTDQYETSNRAAGPYKAPPSVGTAYAGFLASLPVEKVVEGVKLYDKDDAFAYWGSAQMPTMATWLGFLAWFDAQENVAWAEKEVPVGDGWWILLLLALVYAGARTLKIYRTIEDRKIEL